MALDTNNFQFSGMKIPCEEQSPQCFCTALIFAVHKVITVSVVDFYIGFCYNELTAKQEFVEVNICV